MFSFKFLLWKLARGCQKMYLFAHARRLNALLDGTLYEQFKGRDYGYKRKKSQLYIADGQIDLR